MRTYDVTQTLVRTRVIRIRAESREKAIEDARQGYGRIIFSASRSQPMLLCSDANVVKSESEQSAA